MEVVTPATNKTNVPVRWCNENNINYHCLPPHLDFKMKNWDIPKSSSINTNNINSQYEWDIGIVVSFGHLIPKKIINSFRFGMLNMHPSLLPQFS